MDEVRVIEIKKSIFSANEKDADILKDRLKAKKVMLVNVMSSPGSGKTTTLINLINELKKDYRIKVLEADIDGAVDAEEIKEKTGCDALQLHTGGMCHLDAKMTEFGLDHLGIDDCDIIFLENVGNLVCPAEFDTGAYFNMNILSVPEGDDKPLKYPLMYQVCDLVCINKIDVAPYFDFDFNKCQEMIKVRNPKAEVIKISALKGDGIAELVKWFKHKMEEYFNYVRNV